MGPKVAVPAINAGGAVDEPLPSISICTLGYWARNASAHNVMRLFMVSEPMAFTLPATPDAPLLYAGSVGSTLTLCATDVPANASEAIAVAVSIIDLRFMRGFLLGSRVLLMVDRTFAPKDRFGA